MTREEAIHILDNLKPTNTKSSFDAYVVGKAITMATEALEQEPCEDAISRQAALVSIKNLYPDMPIVDYIAARQEWLKKYAPYMECENAIEQLPSVNPQKPKTGHWIFKKNDEETGISNNYWCSECSKPLAQVYKTYCSNCGARMVKPQECKDKE